MNSEAISKLNDLVEIAGDGVYGFNTAADNANNEVITVLFRAQANARETTVHNLKQTVKELGGEAKEGGDIQGALHRTWINLKTALSTKELKSILEECITGERAAEKSITEALKENAIQQYPQAVHVLSNFLEQVQDSLRKLEDALKTYNSVNA